MCYLRFDTSFSIRLKAKPHTGFGNKAYTERGAANAILIYKGIQMRNEESRIGTQMARPRNKEHS